MNKAKQKQIIGINLKSYAASCLTSYVLLGGVSTTLWSCGEIKHQADKALGNQPDKDHRGSQVKPGLETQPGPLELSKAIVVFKDCSETEQWIEDRMIQKLEKSLKARLEQREGFPVPSRTIENNTISETSSSGSAKTSAPESSTPTTTTGTNNQVAGVEEADLVKTQGDRIYQLAGGKLNIMLGWPANQAKFLGSMKIEGTPLEMYVSDAGQAQVISSSGVPNGENILASNPGFSRAEPGFPLALALEPVVVVTTVDTSNPQTPSILSTRSFRGTYLSSRKIGDDLRLVVTEPFGQLNTFMDRIVQGAIDTLSFDPVNAAEIEQLVRDLVEVYKKRIQAKTIQDWLRTGDPNGTGPQIGLCEKVYGPNYETDLGISRIITIKKGVELPLETVLLSKVNGLYASQESLYLSTLHFPDGKNQQGTVLHKFNWESSGNSLYRGSGQVDGVLLNQFSMDEYQGFLRVAATAQDPQTRQNINKISVLSEGEGVLETRGATPNLAQGERIYSVRFAGPRGFLVTFRQVDPLFTLDLKDPTQPKVVGELKIPGFSSYIHMMDDNTLLTIGRGGTGVSTANTKLSVFDVSNLALPKEVKSFVIENRGWNSSEAERNHKAFTYYDQKGVLAIPMNGYRNAAPNGLAKQESSILVFDVKNGPIIKALGSIDVGLFTPNFQSGPRGFATRSLFMDDYIYGFSNLGMKVRKLGELEQDVAVVAFP